MTRHKSTEDDRIPEHSESRVVKEMITPGWFGKGRKKGNKYVSGKRRRRSSDW